MKPISDRWVEKNIEEWSSIYHGAQTQAGKVLLRSLRELARTRAAIRDHKDILKRYDCSNEDRMLYRATLPEGDR